MANQKVLDEIVRGLIALEGEIITELPTASCEAIPGKLAEGEPVTHRVLHHDHAGAKVKDNNIQAVEDLSVVQQAKDRAEYLKAYRAKRLRAMYPPDNSTRYLRRRKLGPDKVEVEKAKAEVLAKVIQTCRRG